MLRNTGEPAPSGCTAEHGSCRNPGRGSGSVRAPPPTAGAASYTRTARPASASVTAALNPFGPAPTTTASMRSIVPTDQEARPGCDYPSPGGPGPETWERALRRRVGDRRRWSEPVVGAAVTLPRLVQIEERRPERIVSHQGHGGAADRPVVRRELAGAREMVRRRGLVAVAAGLRGDTKMEAGTDLVVGKIADRVTRRFASYRHLAIAYPVTNFVEMGLRVDTGEGLEHVGAVRDTVGPNDAVVLVDPDDGRDVADRVHLREQVLGIDQHGKRDAVDEGMDVVGGAGDGDADHRESVGLQLVVQHLPPGQVVATPSPRRERDQQLLPAAPLFEVVRPSVEVGEGERRRLQRVEGTRPLLGGEGHRREGGSRGDDDGAVQRAGDVREVEVPAHEQRIDVPHGDTDVVATESFRLELPPQRRRQTIALDEHAAAVNARSDGADLVADERQQPAGA